MKTCAYCRSKVEDPDVSCPNCASSEFMLNDKVIALVYLQSLGLENYEDVRLKLCELDAKANRAREDAAEAALRRQLTLSIQISGWAMIIFTLVFHYVHGGWWWM